MDQQGIKNDTLDSSLNETLADLRNRVDAALNEIKGEYVLASAQKEIKGEYALASAQNEIKGEYALASALKEIKGEYGLASAQNEMKEEKGLASAQNEDHEASGNVLDEIKNDDEDELALSQNKELEALENKIDTYENETQENNVLASTEDEKNPESSSIMKSDGIKYNDFERTSTQNEDLGESWNILDEKMPSDEFEHLECPAYISHEMDAGQEEKKNHAVTAEQNNMKKENSENMKEGTIESGNVGNEERATVTDAVPEAEKEMTLREAVNDGTVCLDENPYLNEDNKAASEIQNLSNSNSVKRKTVENFKEDYLKKQKSECTQEGILEAQIPRFQTSATQIEDRNGIEKETHQNTMSENVKKSSWDFGNVSEVNQQRGECIAKVLDEHVMGNDTAKPETTGSDAIDIQRLQITMKETFTTSYSEIPQPFAEVGAANKESSSKYQLKLGAIGTGTATNFTSDFPLVKTPAEATDFASGTRRKEVATLGSDCDLKTLEDALIFFGLKEDLQELEKSLEEVRRHQITAEEHETKVKDFDKKVLQMSLSQHPDRVKNRGGTEAEVSRAHKLQIALNATRTVLSVLNKTFLEDIDVDHRYEFFTKLDIGLLGNEDDVQNHVYEVLFKIILISEMKQEKIVTVIKRFLTAAQDCIRFYIEGSYLNFTKQCSLTYYYLRKCIEGYEKLLAQFLEVEEECRSEKMDNIYSLIRSMRKDCANHLEHLERLFKVCTSSSRETLRIYYNRRPLDEYFVLPFVYYTNVILTCEAMQNSSAEKNRSFSICESWFKRRNNSFTRESVGSDNISLLFYLASYYEGNKNYKGKVMELFGKQHRGDKISKEDIEVQFLETLKLLNDDLKRRFKIEDYDQIGSRRFIVKELKKCREMKAEFEMERKEIEKGIRQIRKNTEDMRKRFDKLLRDSEEISSQYHESLADTRAIKTEIENYSRRKQ